MTTTPTLFGFLLAFTVAVAVAQNVDPEQMEVPEGLRDRLWSGTTVGPMSAYFRSNRTATASLIALKKHMQDVDKRLHALSISKRPYGLGSDDSFCNRHEEESERALLHKLNSLGLPAIETNCITEIDLQLDEQKQSELWQNRLTFIDATRQAGLAAIRQMNRIDWNNKVYPHAKFSYVDHIDDCQLIHNVGFRIRGIWSVMVSLTQFPVFIDRGDRRRQYIVEYLTSVNGTAGNILVNLPKMGVESKKVDNTTTTWENWTGRPGSSIFRQTTSFEENPAIAATLRAKGDWREQVEDSRTASNLSILTLSCLFTLVPISSFTDVSLFAVFIYTIGTDIVACIPLSIKGIELLSQTNTDYGKTVVWAFGGLKQSANHSLVIESWSSICKTRSDVGIAGIGLLVFALTLMVVGVILEILVTWRMKRQKKLFNAQQLAEDNESLKQHWANVSPCRNCNCYDVRLSNANFS